MDEIAAGDIFLVSSAQHSRYDTEFYSVSPNYGDADYCPTCSTPISMREWLPPKVVDLELHGSEIGDFAFFSQGDFLVSGKVKSAFDSDQLHGDIQFDEVEVNQIKRARGIELSDRFFHPLISRANVKMAESKSTVVRGKGSVERLMRNGPCATCGSPGFDAYARLSLVRTTDEPIPDMFKVMNFPGSVFATRRLVEAAQGSGWTNFLAVPPEKARWDPLSRLDYEPFDWLDVRPHAGLGPLRFHIRRERLAEEFGPPHHEESDGRRWVYEARQMSVEFGRGDLSEAVEFHGSPNATVYGIDLTGRISDVAQHLLAMGYETRQRRTDEGPVVVCRPLALLLRARSEDADIQSVLAWGEGYEDPPK